MSSSARMDCIITFKILFKILGTLTLQAFLNEFKNRLTSALLQGGPFQNVQCLLAAHSTSHYPSSPVLEGFKVLFTTFPATAPHTYTIPLSLLPSLPPTSPLTSIHHYYHHHIYSHHHHYSHRQHRSFITTNGIVLTTTTTITSNSDRSSPPPP